MLAAHLPRMGGLTVKETILGATPSVVDRITARSASAVELLLSNFMTASYRRRNPVPNAPVRGRIYRWTEKI